MRSVSPAAARDNYLRAARFERPDFIPMTFAVNDACWHAYPQEWLCEQMERRPFLFPDFKAPRLPYTPDYSPLARKDAPFTDDFRCVWQTAEDGILGTVKHHPLADLAGLERYIFPDPRLCSGIGPMDWTEAARHMRERRGIGALCAAGLRHNHTFLQLCNIMGYENLLFAMSDADPRLDRLIAGVEDFNAGIVGRWLALDPDVFGYGEDLGMQTGPMLSPALFRRYILPSYRRLIEPAREKGVLIQMHSDGDIRLLADGLVEGGADILNLQDLVCGIDWIAARFGGKTCVELDIDRQNVTVFGSPAQIDTLIRREAETIGRPEGGLMMVFGMYPGMPLENAAAVMDAMERYAAA
ncbi:MAG: hypothetical protein FWC55_08700 [Firmicutes bacterium]|nr:hypothetical protein [Bacillota bacterium]